MANIEILYKFYLSNEKIESIYKKSYYYVKIEIQKELIEENIENILIEDGYNKNYIELIEKYKYLIFKKEETKLKQLDKEQEKDLIYKLKDLKDAPLKFEEKNNYILYLHIIISPEKEKERIKKEKEKRKIKQNNIIESNFSNINQINKELNEINMQLKYINKDIKKEQNEMITFIKKSLYINKKVLSQYNIKEVKTMIENQNKNQAILKKLNYVSSSNIDLLYHRTNSSTIQENENKMIDIKYSKIFYLFLFLKKEKDIIEEDYSYYKQFLSIHNIVSKQENIKVDLYLKIIKENLFLEQEPNILHLRVDSNINENNQVFFNWEIEKDMIYFEYSLNNLIVYFEKIKNLKLLIISSQNIQEIKNKLDTLKNLKEINIIYINHSREFEKEENDFIEILYDNIVNKGLKIKDSYPKKFNKNNIIIDIKNDAKCYEEKNINSEHENESKDILDFEMMKNNYCLIGRLEELNQCLKDLQIHEKLCLFGARGVGKKSFVKKVGFSALERNIFHKVFFLEINKIDKYHHETKINLLIDEIYEFYDDKNINILLILYFNEPIKKIHKLKELIYSCGNAKKNNIKISYLFTFTLDDTLKHDEQREFNNYLELNHFQIYRKKEYKMSYFKKLFNYCLSEYKIKNKNNYIDLINKIFDSLIDTKLEKSFKLDKINKKTVQKNKFSHNDDINDEIINQIKIEEKISDECEIKKDNNIELINNNINLDNKEYFKGAKINNIFLLVNYIYFFEDTNDALNDVFDKLIKEDNKEIKIKIISNIISNVRDKYIKNIDKIFLYLIKLISGIGQDNFKRLFEDEPGDLFEILKNKLFSLITCEYDGYWIVHLNL